MSRVTILLAMYNGARFLPAQLQSYADQSHTDWALIVSDDGSTDAGPDMVRAFAEVRDVRLIEGPRKGYAANFLHLIESAGPEAEMVALSDQDDVWLAEKLARGVAALTGHDGPALYCARTRIVGPDLEPWDLSPIWTKPFGFENALVQNVAAGNTIMLNRAALNLAQTAIARMRAAGETKVVVHDWWLYQLISGSGGALVHDTEPALLYRQHGANMIGDNRGAQAKLRRLGLVLGGAFQRWNGRNIATLRAVGDLLTPEARSRIAQFDAFRGAGLVGRLRGLYRTGLYRQTREGQLTLWLSAVLGRI
jgi:glycosyltransferase involved in cell wall biosynthesis